MRSGSSFGQPTSGEFGVGASTSVGGSVSSVLSVPKSAGLVDEMMLDQQLMTAFQAGIRKFSGWIFLLCVQRHVPTVQTV